MLKKDQNNLATKKDLADLYNKLDKSFDAKFDIKLGKFAEEVILPAVNEIVSREISNEIGKHRHEMKGYIDNKLAETKGDIISYMKGDQERDKNWKLKVINIFKREKIAKPQELEILTNLLK